MIELLTSHETESGLLYNSKNLTKKKDYIDKAKKWFVTRVELVNMIKLSRLY